MTARPHRRAGFTVLEIIVAVAIFSIGILAVILIFRPGLDTLRLSGEVMRAVRLAEEEAERLEQDAASLPDAIVALGPHGEVLEYDPRDLTAGWGNVSWQPDSIARPRVILGERIDIQRQTRLALPTFKFTPDHVSTDLLTVVAPGARVLEVEAPALFSIGTTVRMRHPDYDPNDSLRSQFDFSLGVVLRVDATGGTIEVQVPVPDVGQGTMPPGSKIYGPGLVVIYSTDEMRRVPTAGALLAARGGPYELTAYVLEDTTGAVLLNPGPIDRFVKLDYTWAKAGVPLKSEARVNDGRADLLTPIDTPPIRRPQPGVYWVPAALLVTVEVGGLPSDFATVGDPRSEGVNRPLGDPGAGRVEAALIRQVDGSVNRLNESFSGVLPSSAQAFIALNGDGARDGMGALLPGHYEIVSPDLHFGTAFLEFAPTDAGRQVKMDYRVADWGLLREDHTVEPSGDVSLRLDDVKGPEVRTPPRTPVPQPVVVHDGAAHFVVAVDPTTGQMLLDNRDFLVDYRRGLVTGLDPFIGSRLRFFYRSRQDWLVQVFKPRALYTRGQMVQANQFYMADDRTMQFPLDIVGSTLLVDYRATDGDFVSGEVVQLREQSRLAIGSLRRSVDDGGLMLARGVSVRVRVAWVVDGRTLATPPAGREDEGPQLLNARWVSRQVELFITRRELGLP